jgi:hypothetical protein
MITLHHRAATEYTSLNLPCCPIHGKSPGYAGGRGWPDATTVRDKLDELFETREHSGVGIATGERAGAFVLDGDGAPGRRSLISLIEQYGDLPKGPMCVTGGGGFHLWFAWDDRCATLRNSVRWAEGLDIRTSGGGVVAPPSIHPDTQRRYEWRVGRSCYDLAFPSAPQWLLDAIISTYAPQPTSEAIKSTAPASIAETNYAEAALLSAEQKIKTAPDGQQRITLNAEAVSIGKRIVGAKLYGKDDAIARLVAAGLKMTNHRRDKWTVKSVEAVVTSGLEFGIGRASNAA